MRQARRALTGEPFHQSRGGIQARSDIVLNLRNGDGIALAVALGIPSLGVFGLLQGGGHLGFSPIIPMTGEAFVRRHARVRCRPASPNPDPPDRSKP